MSSEKFYKYTYLGNNFCNFDGTEIKSFEFMLDCNLNEDVMKRSFIYDLIVYDLIINDIRIESMNTITIDKVYRHGVPHKERYMIKYDDEIYNWVWPISINRFKCEEIEMHEPSLSFMRLRNQY